MENAWKAAARHWWERMRQAERERDEMSVEDVVADEIKQGDFDDILGVREPTPEDVQREAKRVFGAPVAVSISWNTEITFSKYVYDVGWQKRMVTPYMPTNRPASFAAAYAALRALPDWKEEE